MTSTIPSPTVAPAKRVKFQVIRLIRRAGLLRAADRCRFEVRRLRTASANRRFLASHPEFVPPPRDLAFDAYNHFLWSEYLAGGKRHAEFFTKIVTSAIPNGPLRVLEWGCGPARITRHLPALYGSRLERLVATDYNPRTIDWCRRALPGIVFETNGLLPPLAVPDGAFNATFNFSVFTHLSREVQLAWVAEMLRVLSPGGIMVCTTQGLGFRHLLSSEQERAQFDAGQLVVQGHYKEGAKWFFAIHPEDYVRRELLAGFATVERIPTRVSDGLPEELATQDFWLARKAG